MSFNSLVFLVFLPIVIGVYWLLPDRFRQVWLLAASYYFYMYWNPCLVFLLLTSTCIDYFCGRGLEKHADRPRLRKTVLLVSICMNLGLLFFFKYYDFFASSINQVCVVISMPYRLPTLNLLLPIGISFYTFQTMSYTIDVYRKEVPAERNFIHFALYVTFFPQLVAGPIESPKNLLPQLKAQHSLNWSDFSAGLRLLASGFFRKCAVADLCGRYVNVVFEDAAHADALSIMIAGALFCIQMYCDFAGYSEIAAGSARLMGIRLMRNFDRPYLSQSYSEFFRRWHISLSRWFTNYLYIPLGGNRKGPVKRVINTLIVFSLCGLWHGANWTYVIWGLYAAFFVSVEGLLYRPACRLIRARGWDMSRPEVVLGRRVMMFLIFLPAALFFRAESVSQIGVLLSGLVHGPWSLDAAFSFMGLSSFSLVQLGLTLAAMAEIYRFGLYDWEPAATAAESARRQTSFVYLLLIIALSWLALLSTKDAAGFAYFQF